MCGLSIACLWPGFGLDLDSLGARSRVVLCGLLCGHLLCHNWS